MTGVTADRTRASVTVRPDPYGEYTDRSIMDLEQAVLAVCRAVDTAAARSLAERVAERAT